MKRSPLIFAALTPFVAAAGGGDKADKMVNYDELRDDWRVSEIIGSEVQSKDGQERGEVEDLVLTADGKIESLLIKADDLGSDRDQATFRDDDAATADRGAATGPVATERDSGMAGTAGDTGIAGEETGLAETETAGTADTRVAGTAESDADRTSDLDGTADTAADDRTTGVTVAEDEQRDDDSGLFGMGGEDEDLVSVAWSSPSFNADDNVIQLDIDQAQLQMAQNVSAEGSAEIGSTEMGDDAAISAGTGQQHRASEIIGMDVRLSDEDSFGSVDDILVNAEGEASAFVVTAWDFLDRKQYALPVNAQGINAEEELIQYNLSSQDLEQQGEFDYDEHLERS